MKLRHVDVVHLYYSSPGVAGLYLRAIEEALEGQGLEQVTIANYYYPFDGRRIFFKLTERYGDGLLRGAPRKAVRYVELTSGLLRAWLIIMQEHPRFLNYSLTNSFRIERLFLRAVRLLTATKIGLTCHDAIPFASLGRPSAKQMRSRKELLKASDVIIVHNHYSQRELVNQFGIDPRRIIFHPFPIMDPTKMELGKSLSGGDARYWDFCFVGIPRREKGVDVLLDAWAIFQQRHPLASLVIAGDWSVASDDVKAKAKLLNLTIVDGYIKDKDFVSVLQRSRYCVLPYTTGTNSGIPGMAISLGTRVLASNIPMFVENDLIANDQLFESNSVSSLVTALTLAYTESDHSNDGVVSTQAYQANFEREVGAAYRRILLDFSGGAQDEL